MASVASIPRSFKNCTNVCGLQVAQAGDGVQALKHVLQELEARDDGNSNVYETHSSTAEVMRIFIPFADPPTASIYDGKEFIFPWTRRFLQHVRRSEPVTVISIRGGGGHASPGYFSGRNGFAASLAGLKAGTPPPPFLLPPPTVPSSQAGKEHQEEGRSPGEPLVAGLVGFPPPVGDMNATQVLLSMVRSHAGAAHQLENYLKGAVKAQHQEAVPLDLSTSARPGPQQPQQPPLKRYKRQSLGESLYGCELTGAGGLLLAAARQHTSQQPHKKSPGSPKTSRRRPAAPTCLSACSTASAQDRPSPVQPCTPESQTLLHWTVDDVVTFVASLDACAEYAPDLTRDSDSASRSGGINRA
ncbi:hypothetical protein AAG570_009823 [Ranatra chinensis]|uniref:Uncharacterized protein n=1 Tax=Ranatra chinensis TaxID=642074 RepID=A0ABD0YQA9_9HEMI